MNTEYYKILLKMNYMRGLVIEFHNSDLMEDKI